MAFGTLSVPRYSREPIQLTRSARHLDGRSCDAALRPQLQRTTSIFSKPLKAFDMAIKTVGIVGAGTMGNGIAQACAVVGLNVVMVDISDAAVQKGVATVSGSLDR
ncbi:3-hydroxyacyl-CoA dehydrogenase NAD-binding domain-containing protein, partial [Cupriavidus sp. AcVe19-6a]|uniref:3-hydroxyacyl-CoA dehydrogenase NAD-binding domain-containing protein n=1 Tax=Cupriavidus sp. AcVe19-6a TaxID=2821358 RepID=UPI00352C6EF8